MEKIFVYGSLLPDFWNHDKVFKHRLRGTMKGCLKDFSLYHLPAGYPAIVPGEDTIYGEVCILSHTKHLKSIDLLEGYTGNPDIDLYTREKRLVILENGQEEWCWVYLYINHDYVKNKGLYIPHGDWKKFMFQSSKQKKKPN